MSAEPDPGLLQGFACVARWDAQVLILGSMPGKASLDQDQYYAHPRNAFWYIMGRLFNAGDDKPYSLRLKILQQQGIALWDVVHRCARKGSLDADIEHDSVEPNDLQSLFEQCPDIRHVFFNGRKAAELYRRMVEPTLEPRPQIQYLTLPSTSPAHASLNREAKLREWSRVKEILADWSGQKETGQPAGRPVIGD